MTGLVLLTLLITAGFTRSLLDARSLAPCEVHPDGPHPTDQLRPTTISAQVRVGERGWELMTGAGPTLCIACGRTIGRVELMYPGPPYPVLAYGSGDLTVTIGSLSKPQPPIYLDHVTLAGQ